LEDSPNVNQLMVTIDPKHLIGRTFLMASEEDGQRFRARVVCAVVDREERKGLDYTNFFLQSSKLYC
jgi:hypothetical protein